MPTDDLTELPTENLPVYKRVMSDKPNKSFNQFGIEQGIDIVWNPGEVIRMIQHKHSPDLPGMDALRDEMRQLEDEVLALYRQGGSFAEILARIYHLRALRKLLGKQDAPVVKHPVTH